MSKFINALAQMPNASLAARAAGVSRGHAYDVRTGRRGFKDEAFAEAWAEAIDISVEMAEAVARTRALRGEPRTVTRTRRVTDEHGNLVTEEITTEETHHISDTLLIFLLKAHKPEMYRERYDVRHSGADGGPVQVEMNEIYRRPTAERMRELIQLARELEEPVIEGEIVDEAPAELTEGHQNGNHPE